MGDGQTFTFDMEVYPALNYLAARVELELTNPFTEIVGNGSDWQVDAVNYRLKYINPTPKIYQISCRFQQDSATTAFRPIATFYMSFPIVEMNRSNFFSGSPSNGVTDQYPSGFFINVEENSVIGFTIQNNTGANPAGTATNFRLRIFLNELR